MADTASKNTVCSRKLFRTSVEALGYTEAAWAFGTVELGATYARTLFPQLVAYFCFILTLHRSPGICKGCAGPGYPY